MSIFKACDVRGVVGEQWDADDALRIGRSLGRMLHRRAQSEILVGGDFRRSTPRLKEALTDGLRQIGIRVLDAGQGPTPVIQFAARHVACPNAAIVTASHNPGRYNGIKFLVDGRPPVPDLIAELREGLSDQTSTGSLGSITQLDPTCDYRHWVLRRSASLADACRASLDPTTRRKTAMAPSRQWHVVVDAMGGAFTHLAASLLADAGYQVTSVDDQLDPDFQSRDPNPARDANLNRLVDGVRQHGADIGLALDGDGDRVIFVDQHGTIARPEQIAVILVELAFGRCTVVYDLKCASLLPRAVVAAGGNAVMQPSGHGFIRTAMGQYRAELGVEVSGHHFWNALDGGDDGLFTALFLLRLLDASGATLADLLHRIGWPAITPDLRLPFTGDPHEVLDRIASTCGGQVQRLDGVRAAYDRDGWGLARASITEPAITFRFEGQDPNHLHTVIARFLSGLPDLKRRVETLLA